MTRRAVLVGAGAVAAGAAAGAIQWLRRRQAFAPDRPFMMYWAPGAAHGPHHVSQAWADRYRGRFDDGWDAMRERVFTRQKSMGWIPPDTRLTPREASMVSWDSIRKTSALSSAV